MVHCINACSLKIDVLLFKGATSSENQQGNEWSIVSVCLWPSLMFPSPVLECACVGNKRPCFFQTLQMFPWEAPFENIILKEHFLGWLLLEMLLLMTEIWKALTSLKLVDCQTSNHGSGFWENNLGKVWNLGLQASFECQILDPFAFVP